jgi:regulator of replication initiation timing
MENVENLILEHLRAIRADVSGIKDDMREVKQRLANVEAAVGGVKRDQSDLYTENASHHVRYDRLLERIDRIERRLELQS